MKKADAPKTLYFDRAIPAPRGFESGEATVVRVGSRMYHVEIGRAKAYVDKKTMHAYDAIRSANFIGRCYLDYADFKQKHRERSLWKKLQMNVGTTVPEGMTWDRLLTLAKWMGVSVEEVQYEIVMDR